MYKVYRASYSFNLASDAGVTHIGTVEDPGNSFIDTGLDDNTRYYYKVSAVDLGDQGNGLFSIVLESDLSELVSGETADDTPPGAVTTLAAVAGLQEGEISLSWNWPGDNGYSGAFTGEFRIAYSSYVVVWSTVTYQAQFSVIGKQPGSTDTHTIANLTPSTTYYFRVWVRDDANLWSEMSNGATAYAKDMPPMAPTNVNVTTSGEHYITLNWTRPGNTDLAGYKIYFDTDSADEPYTGISATAGSSPISTGLIENYTLTGLASPVTYYIAITAVDGGGLESVYSTVVSSRTVLYAPSDLHGVVLSTGSIYWAWMDNSAAEIGYRVYSAAGVQRSPDLSQHNVLHTE
jgi:titin